MFFFVEMTTIRSLVFLFQQDCCSYQKITMDNAGQVITSPSDDDKQCRSKQFLTEKLDRAEMIIENIRREALKMAEDLDNVYNSVDAVRNSKSMNYLSDGEYPP